MKQLLILLLAFITSCTSHESAKPQESEHESDKEHTATTVPLNGGAKWKADETTKKNVAAMAHILNDSTYQHAGKREALTVSIRSQIDTLVKQCSMKGPEHDALHVWLKKTLKDVKELEEDHEEFEKVYAALKNDVASFYTTFE